MTFIPKSSLLVKWDFTNDLPACFVKEKQKHKPMDTVKYILVLYLCHPGPRKLHGGTNSEGINIVNIFFSEKYTVTLLRSKVFMLDCSSIS